MFKRLLLAVAACSFVAWASAASAQIPAGNHLACYQVKDLKVPAKFVSPASIAVDDQVSTGSVSKCKPKFLCVPTEKDGNPIVTPGLDYICYQCKGAKPAVAFDVTDQFGGIRVQTKKIKFVCDPAQKTPA